MKIRNFLRLKNVLLITGVLLLLFMTASCGSNKPKVYKVGILSGIERLMAVTDGFKAKMTELGYTEGKNITYDLQKCTTYDKAAYETILKKFIADKVDLVFCYATEAAMDAKALLQGTKIPVVFAFGDIDSAKLVNSVTEPGNNITGVRIDGTELSLKRLETFNKIVPKAKRYWIAYTDGIASSLAKMTALRPAAQTMGAAIVEVPAKGIADIQADLDKRAQSADIGIDAMLLVPDAVTSSNASFELIAKFAADHKIPLAGLYTASGGYEALFGITNDNANVGNLAATSADKILKGTDAGTLPVLSPENYLTISYKEAQRLGIEIPETILQLATKIIK